jgi:integrase
MARSYQTGTLIKRKLKDGSTSYRLIYRVKQPDGSWKLQSETLYPDEDAYIFSQGRGRSGSSPRGALTLSEAKEKAERRLKEINQANNGVLVAPTVTFRELVENHFYPYIEKENLRASTKRGYKVDMNAQILPYLGSFPVRHIVPETITGFMTHLRNKGLSSKYQLNIYNRINFCFKLAITVDLIKVSPIKELIHRPKYVKKEKPTFPLEKFPAFFAAVPAKWKPLVATLALTGVRLSELLGLRWCDVDFANKTLYKRNVVFKGQLIEGLKETRRRTSGNLRQHAIGIPRLLHTYLKQQLKQSSFTKAEDFVFPSPEDGRPLNPDRVRKFILYPALKAAGIEREKGTFGPHIFRHTAGTVVLESTGRLDLAQQQLGHTDIQTTSNIYIHPTDDQKHVAADALDKAFEIVFEQAQKVQQDNEIAETVTNLLPNEE